MFQIVRLALDDNGEVTARRPLQLFRTLGRRDCDGGVRCIAALGGLRMRRRAGLLVGDRHSGTEISLFNRTGQAYRHRGLNWAHRPGILPAAAIFAGPMWQVMPITQFLDSPKFDPETKRVVGVAFEMARAALCEPISPFGPTTRFSNGIKAKHHPCICLGALTRQRYFSSQKRSGAMCAE
jgi:hypothetical protein